MKHVNTIALFVILGSSFPALASEYTEAALKLVPGGKVVQEKSKEVKVETTNGSIVEVEFKRDGTFEEASGDNLEKDNFVPGKGLISLQETVASLKKAGKSPVGDWSLEDSMLKGWHYEFEGFENGKNMDYLVDAKTGKLLESKIDD